MEGMGPDGMHPSGLRELFSVTARPPLPALKHDSARGRFLMTANKQNYSLLQEGQEIWREILANQPHFSTWEGYGANSFQSHLCFEWRLSCMFPRDPFLPKLFYGCDL